MRSTIPVSVLLSLAVHAGAVLAITAIALPHRPFSPKSDLTVALTMLPTPQRPSESPGAQAARDEPAVSAAEPLLPEVQSEKAVATDAPTEAPPAARVAEAAPAVEPQAPLVAAESDVPPAGPAAPRVADAFPSPVPEATPATASSEAGTALDAPPDQAATDMRQLSPPLSTAERADEAPTVAAEPSANAPAIDARVPQSTIEPPPAAAEARADETPADAPSQTAPTATPSVALALPAEGAAKADDPAATATPGPPTVVASAAPQSLVASDAPEDDAALRRAGAFIEAYDGGPCVYVSAVRLASGAAEIDGLAAATPPFELVLQGFAALAGFEPHVTGQRVWSPQCPAVDYLKRLHARRIAPPSLSLDAVKIGGGAALHGTIHDPAHRPLHLFLVTETGLVADLTTSLVETDGEARFTLTERRTTHEGSVPQLLVAVAGSIAMPRPPDGAVPATLFFDGLSTGVDAPGAAAKLFLLGD